MQQCYAFTQAGGGTWTGLKKSDVTDGLEAGTAVVTPTAPGSYTYALTCGGIETGLATLIVNGAPGSISLFTNSPVYVGSPVTLTANVYGEGGGAAPTGSIAFSVGNVSVGSLSLSGGTTQLSIPTSGLPPGSYTFTANYSGDSTYASGSAISTVVLQAYTTDNALYASPNPVVEGQTIVLTSKATRNVTSTYPSGTVTFSLGSNALGTATLDSGTATLSLPVSTSVPPGSYSLTASYPGDGADGKSTSLPLSVVVQAATTTVLAASPTTVPCGQTVTFTSTVSRVGTSGAPTGTVTFYDGTVEIGAAILNNGIAQFAVSITSGSLPSGSYTVTANYSGDTLDTASNSGGVAITVNPICATTITSLTASPNTLAQGHSLTLSAGLFSYGHVDPTGSVAFYVGNTVIGAAQVSDYTASLTETIPAIPAGTYAITATYSGDANNAPSTSQAANVTVLAATNTRLTVNPNPVPANHTFTLESIVSEVYGSLLPTGTVTFSTSNSNLGTITLDDGTASLNLTDFGLPAGTYPITASYSGDATNSASTVSSTVTIR